MRALAFLLLLTGVPRADDALVQADAIRRHQEVLASDDFEGREAGSDGGHKAALYIAAQVRALGLSPGGEAGGFFQPFGEGKPGPIEDSNVLAAGKAEFKLRAGFVPHRSSPWTDLEAPASAFVVRDDPGPGKRAAAAEEAAGKGAKALLLTGVALSDEFAWPPGAGSPALPIPVASVSKEAAQAVAAAAGPVRLSVSPSGPPGKGMKNVIAIRPGADAGLRSEYVVVAAHYDHVGRGHRGSNGGKVGEIHNGADDNASGSSALLALAAAVARSSFKRTVVLMWFDAEERSLAGSRHWAAHPTLEIARCVAMVNCDMIGRNGAKEIFCGLEKDKEGKAVYPKWEAEVKSVEAKFGQAFDWKKFDPFIRRSDHWPFMEKGVPALFFTGGLHADYHKEGDDVEKINFAKEELIGRIVLTLAARAADSPAGYR